MSSFAYGRIVSERSAPRSGPRPAATPSGKDENKLVAAIAAIVPVEVIARHSLILGATTTTDPQGVITIKQGSEGALQASLIGLVVVTLLLYLFGRGLSNWKPLDVLRLVIPAIALIVWTALIGTSALTPWVRSFEHGAVVTVAVIVGIIITAVTVKITPSN